MILTYVTAGIMLVAIVLMIIGCFGDIAAMGSYSVNMSYYFGDGFDEVNNYSNMPYPELYIFELILMIFQEALYFTMMAGVITFGVLAMVKAIVAMVGKKEFELKFITPIFMCVLPYFVILMLRLFMGSKSTGVGMGWGSVLLTVGLFLLIACILLQDLRKNLVRREGLNGILARSFHVGALFFGMISFLAVFGVVLEASGLKMTLARPVEAALNPLSMGGDLPDGGILAMIGFFVGLAGYNLMLFPFAGSMKKAKVSKIVMLIIGFATTIAGIVLSMISMNDLYGEGGMSANAIVFIIFMVLTIGLMITSFAFAKKAQLQD